MADECIICGAPLEYLEDEIMMECAICHKKELSRARCIKGHYVCNECHIKGIDSIMGVCLRSASKDPVAVLDEMMALPFCHMHGPEHHIMVACALLTAYKNAGGQIDLQRTLSDAMRRGKQVPGGTCGYWGACGAAISSGIFISIITQASPLSAKPLGHANRMTSASLAKVGAIGGPRCCKRNSYLAILSAIDFVKDNFGIEMEKPEKISCTHIAENDQCIGADCPFCG